MTHNYSSKPLWARYGDLLGPDLGADPELTRLVADLDAFYAAEAPAELPSAFDAVILPRVERVADDTDDLLADTGLSRISLRPIARRTRTREGVFTVPTRRISTLLGSIAAVLVVGLLAAVLIGMAHGGSGQPGPGETGAQHFARIGGLQLVLQVQECPAAQPNCSVDTEMAKFLQAERDRAASILGVKDAVVTNTKGSFVEIDLPGYGDVTQASDILGNAGVLDVIDTGSTQLVVGSDVSDRLCPVGNPCPSDSYLIYFTGDQLDRASITSSVDTTTGAPIVTFAFAGAARDSFATYTAQHIGKPLTMTLDGKVIESALLESEITGTGQITGLSFAESHYLAGLLKLGPLPLSATLLSVTIFGPGSTCATPIPGTPPVFPGTATPAPNATATPVPPQTPTPKPSGQSANFAPVYNGGPGQPSVCDTPTPSNGTPAPTIPPTPARDLGTPTTTPLPTPLPPLAPTLPPTPTATPNS